MTNDQDTRISYGAPITSRQAAMAVLREIHSPIIGDIEVDPDPGYTLRRLYDEPLAHMLSSGEQRLRDIAQSLWGGGGADIAELGGLDRELRRKVWIILGYYFLGADLPFEGFTKEEWSRRFEVSP